MTKHVFHNINKIITSIYIDYIQTIVNYNINVCTTATFIMPMVEENTGGLPLVHLT